jgi:heme o synthase
MARYRSDNLLQIILELSKVRITMAVAVTTIAGYIFGTNGYNAGFILPTLGIFLLACGSSVINHLQERRTDAFMTRTSQRPIPAQKVSVKFAILLAGAETLAGSAVLYFSAGRIALFLGWFAIFWYNVVYTNLKKKTVHAVIPGSVIGSIPPLVGWVAAQRGLLALEPLLLALFFFIWQVPHFYLLAAKYGQDYENAGLPSLTRSYSPEQIKRAVFFWVVMTALSAAGYSYSRPSGTWISSIFIVMISIWLIVTFSSLLKHREDSFSPGKYFMKINYYVLAVILVLTTDPALQKYLSGVGS